jgi:nucleoside-diphosphate-sugar epimerase
MRVLVIGGTRFMGPHVVKSLAGMGHEVTVFHRGQTEADLPQGVQHIHGERQRLPDFREEFKRLAPDVMLDMCAFTEEDARTAVSVLHDIATRAVAISSMDVYYNYGLFPHTQTEPGPPHPNAFSEAGPLRQVFYPYRKMTKGPDDLMHGTPMYHYDTHRIRSELGYAEAVPQDEALRRTVEWERAHPPEKIDPAQFDYAAEDAVLGGL